MSEKEHTPITQTNGHPHHDWESTEAGAATAEPRRKNRTKCVLYIVLFAIFQTAIILIFALFIAKFRTPKLELRSAALQNVNQNSTAFAARITAELRLRNANFGKYKYQNTTVTFLYKGTPVGEVDVRKSSVNWRSREGIEVAAELDLGRAAGNELVEDLRAGVVRVESRAMMEGRVAVLFVLKKKRATDLDCTMDIVMGSEEIRNIVCK